MEYMTVKEASQSWGVSQRYVQRLLHENRIGQAKKYGRSWMIPAEAKKPGDPRKEKKERKENRTALIFLTSVDLPRDNPDAVLQGMEEEIRLLAVADLAFRRGDPEPAKQLWRETPREAGIKLSVASLATAAAISSGDYLLYHEIHHYLQVQSTRTDSPQEKALLSLPQTLAAVSMAVPGMTPEWLKNCDFSLFSQELRPFLLFLYTMHLRNMGDYAQMLGVANASLMLNEKQDTFTWIDVYFSVLCAVAANALREREQMIRYLDAALTLGLPCGFIAPFADYLGSFSGNIEDRIRQKSLRFEKSVTSLWNVSFKNWMRFHNLFARDNITTVLSAQEYQAAYLIVHGETYAGTARRMHLSVSRIKHILSDVYEKLLIQNKQELGAYIL